MSIENIKVYIESKFDDKSWTPNFKDYEIWNEFKNLLNRGEIRAAQLIDGAWHTNTWVKKGILLGFRIGKIANYSNGNFSFYDKHTYPLKSIDIHEGIRVVPGGTSVRDGAYVGKLVTIMPPSYINVGAYVDEGSMLDSHVLVGSCAQVGKNVHISAAAIIGGVLEPIGANPVIIEDNVFIGGNSGIYEGAIIKTGAVIAAGVIITSGTPIYDATRDKWITKESGKGLIIPENAVVVQGSRPLKANPDLHVSCPIIIKYRDSKTNTSVVLESALR
ncbi:MAG TPA: 2,3,4,5-tetrahydropyridine-2,6-dicarboxylate N-succinyltransferase [Candidatus Cloacimonadota bacterium]|nr:2,3,4,5-tetrahydropyridine-2,6-dicarboxylate N-succinyltransferase [Candidatus Cloacimonadales bacterium]HPY97115.1 2,3,4,5-tetrahydropyridine-2,6-dicarboxylate N-succinyltransferase [Candidatus Cloacimonadota bacterium]HQB41142.1 2,3,4,5-tetrahydropyridine-2,6-dicarboxylate N-succinyltransferase [Candidatus Cloacimonadota bacterium]